MGRNWKNKPHTYAGIKQQASKQPMDQSRDQTGNQKLPWDKWKWKHKLNLWDAARSVKRKVHSCISLPQKQQKSQINNINLHLKKQEKEEHKSPSEQKKEIKIRVEIKKTEMMEKINTTKSWFFEKIK